MKKKILYFLICCFINFEVCAAFSGSCAKDENSSCEWSFDETSGTLTISGSGDMKNYSEVYSNLASYNPDNIAPWYEYGQNIQKVVVEEGITSIGNASFEKLPNLQEATLPQGLKTIGNNAFNNCVALSSIKIPDTVTSIGGWAFYHTDLSEVELPPNLSTLSPAVLYRVPLTTLVIPDNISTISETAFNYWAEASTTLQNLYCPEHLKEQCAKAVKDFTLTPVSIQTYQKLPNGELLIGGKFYQNPNDIYGDNRIKKRIYTVNEANMLSGKKNKVMIRYK